MMEFARGQGSGPKLRRRLAIALSSFVLGGGVALSPASAVAQAEGRPPEAARDTAESVAAEALYEQARQLLTAGKLAEACEKFAASNALEPGVGTLLYLGDCYERTGRFASAITTFRQAGTLAHDRGDAERARVAEVRSAALQPRAPKLEVRVPKKSELPGLQVTLNGTPIAQQSWNVPQYQDAGVYEVRVAAPGYDAFTSRIELRNGESDVTVVKIPVLVDSEREVSAQSPPSNQQTGAEEGSSFLTQETLGLIIGGAGVLLAGTTGVLAAFANSSNQDSYDFCDPSNQNQCGREGVRLREEAQDFAAVATITGIAATAAVAGGLVLYLTAPGLESGTPEAAVVHVRGHFDWF